MTLRYGIQPKPFPWWRQLGRIAVSNRQGRTFKIMHPHQYERFVQVVLDWIDRTLESHSTRARTVASFGCPKLPSYFSPAVLTNARVVVTDELPVPPLSKWGLPELFAFESQLSSGITYRNTYFLHPSVGDDEAVHFHELVHVIQWQVLGPRDFLLCYGTELLQYGYEDCPLEKMAYDHERRFEAGDPPYDVEVEVRKALGI